MSCFFVDTIVYTVKNFHMNFDLIKKNTYKNTVILKQSLGKDAVLCLDILHNEGFNIINIYDAWIPHLPSDVEYIQYLKNLYPRTKWVSTLHRSIPDEIVWGSYMTLEKVDQFWDMMQKYEDFNLDRETKVNFIKSQLGGEVWMATGLKKSDSPRRRTTINRYKDNIDVNRKFCYPVAEYTDNQVFDELKHRNVKLHWHYQLFGRSFEGICGKYMPALYYYAEKSNDHALKERAKRDIEHIESIFPLAKAKVVQQQILQKRIAYGRH